MGVQALADEVDTLIVVPNNKLLSVLDKQTSMVDAFRVADDVLRQGVQGISDLVTLPGLINLDFADVRTIMSEAGNALLGIGMGHGRGPRRRRGARRDRVAAAGDLDGGRAQDPALDHRRARTSRCGRSTRRPRPSARPPTPTRTSSSAPWSTRSSARRCGSPSSPPATPRAACAPRAATSRSRAARCASSAARARATTRQTGLGVHELDVPSSSPAPDRLTEDRYELPPARLERWLDRWAERHENVAWTSVGERDVAFVGADGERVVCEPPFPPLDAAVRGERAGYEPGPLLDHVRRERTVGVLLVRLGGHAAGVFKGERAERTRRSAAGSCTAAIARAARARGASRAAARARRARRCRRRPTSPCACSCRPSGAWTPSCSAAIAARWTR